MGFKGLPEVYGPPLRLVLLHDVTGHLLFVFADGVGQLLEALCGPGLVQEYAPERIQQEDSVGDHSRPKLLMPPRTIDCLYRI